MSVIPFLAPQSGADRVSDRPRHGRARRLVERARIAFVDWRRRVRNRNELLSLDERTLHDLGISRSDTLYLTSKAAEREALWRDSLRLPPL